MKGLVFFATLALLGLGTGAMGQVPAVMPFQAVLTDSQGDVLAPNTAVTFSIYDAEVDGAVVWGPETHTVTPDNNGVVSVYLGDGDTPEPMNSGAFAVPGERWLAIEIGGGALSRIRVGSTGFAFNAERLGGLPTSSFAPAGHVHNYALNNLTDVNAASPATGQVLTYSGGAWTSAAPAPIASNSITSAMIQNGAVTSTKILDGAVNSAKIQDGTLTATDIATNMVSSVEGVINDGGNIDLIAGAGLTVAGSDAANTITMGTAMGGMHPIAYGIINTDATVRSAGSGNWTVSWNTSLNAYEVAISGINFNLWSHMVTVQGMGYNVGRTFLVDGASSHLMIAPRMHDGTVSQFYCSFMVYAIPGMKAADTGDTAPSGIAQSEMEK